MRETNFKNIFEDFVKCLVAQMKKDKDPCTTPFIFTFSRSGKILKSIRCLELLESVANRMYMKGILKRNVFGVMYLIHCYRDDSDSKTLCKTWLNCYSFVKNRPHCVYYAFYNVTYSPMILDQFIKIDRVNSEEYERRFTSLRHTIIAQFPFEQFAS